jgi:hypothetical protein
VIALMLASAISYAGVVGWCFANNKGHVFNMPFIVCRPLDGLPRDFATIFEFRIGCIGYTC